ncbi:MAG: hypothetical protein H7249_13215 [Chitinophagaceae bacterium]|nr:hypothetical protein [Oligoflexus sp.]
MQISSLKSKVEGMALAKKMKDIFFLLNVAGYSLVVIFCAYVVASLINSVLVAYLGGSAVKKKAVPALEVNHPRIEKTTNYRDLRKTVLARNVFNSEGILPDEPDPSEGASNAFNPNDKCQKPTVNVELLGIIATGNPETSLATIQEKGYTMADVYHAGEKIINQEEALIYAIEEDKVVLNNKGVKECLELNTVKVLATASASGANGTNPANPAAPPGDAGPGEQCPSGSASLESSYVEESLGPGFSKILEAGRLVPFHGQDNAMVGFKLIGVRGGSLWSRANLGSGDVITAVNGVSMAQPEKGFALYEALQSDKAIRVEFLKAGKTPCILNVEIK